MNTEDAKDFVDNIFGKYVGCDLQDYPTLLRLHRDLAYALKSMYQDNFVVENDVMRGYYLVGAEIVSRRITEDDVVLNMEFHWSSTPDFYLGNKREY